MGDSERVRRIRKVTCWWCSKPLRPRNVHHEALASPKPRPCCKSCYSDQDGHYRSVYPEGQDQEESELAEHLMAQIKES